MTFKHPIKMMKNNPPQQLKTIIEKELKKQFKKQNNETEIEKLTRRIEDVRKQSDELKKRINRDKQRLRDGRENTNTFISESAVKFDWYVTETHTYRPSAGIEKIKEIRYWCS